MEQCKITSDSLYSDNEGRCLADCWNNSISSCKDNQPVQNLIGKLLQIQIRGHDNPFSALALAQRIISAAQEGRKFKVFILIPAVPYVVIHLT